MDNINITGNAGVNNGSVRRISPDVLSSLQTDGSREIWGKDEFVPASESQEVISPDKASGVIRKPSVAVDFVNKYSEGLNLPAEDLAQKKEMMSKDAFAFFRITPALFYRDMHNEYAGKSMLLDTPAPTIVINGDSHLQNFGTIKTPDGKTAWGLNDYDQTGTGSPEWDLERLAASAVLAFRGGRLRGKDEKELVKKLGNEYFDTIKDIARGKKQPHSPYLSKNESDSSVSDLISKMEKTTHKDLLDKYVVKENGDYHFKENEILHQLGDSEKKALMGGLKDYESRLGSTSGIARPLQIIDMAQKLGSGGSSYGLKRYYALVKAEKSHDDPRIIEIKQFPPSAVDTEKPDLSLCNAKALTEYQQEMGGLTNPLSGYTKIDDFDFLVREREPQKAGILFEDLDNEKDFGKLFKQAAKVLAYAHAPNEKQAQAIAKWVDGNEKKAVENLADFARSYTDQTEKDWEAFKV